MAYPTNGAQGASDQSAVLLRLESVLSVESAGTTTSQRRFPVSSRPRSLPRPIWVLVAALMIALLLPAAMPATAARAASAQAAADCGTNWTSTRKPPTTIRVLLTDHAKKRVIVVPFREYVAMVMASGEFPTWLPPAVLQAGATAVKQYGWYYAMKGHHRSTYRTKSGVCYDVRNDTNDQLYRTVAHPTAKQLKAIDATWGLTLHKGKRFFLTGYRAGVKSKCGADADGWRLYAKSMIDCAKLGWSRQQIQVRYYAPRIAFVWRQTTPPPPGDSTPPTVSVPEAVPAATQPDPSRVRVSVTWSGSDNQSGVASYRLQERAGSGAWRAVPLSTAGATSAEIDAQPGVQYQFRLKAADVAGNRTSWVPGVTFTAQVTQSNKAKLRGTWTPRTSKRASGGAILTTTQAGATASLSFHGSAVGVLAVRGPNMGKARIRIDGVVVDVIDLRSAAGQNRRVVFSHAWTKAGNHTIKVEALGTAGRPLVDVDAFVLLH